MTTLLYTPGLLLFSIHVGGVSLAISDVRSDPDRAWLLSDAGLGRSNVFLTGLWLSVPDNWLMVLGTGPLQWSNFSVCGSAHTAVWPVWYSFSMNIFCRRFLCQSDDPVASRCIHHQFSFSFFLIFLFHSLVTGFQFVHWNTLALRY